MYFALSCKKGKEKVVLTSNGFYFLFVSEKRILLDLNCQNSKYFQLGFSLCENLSCLSNVTTFCLTVGCWKTRLARLLFLQSVIVNGGWHGRLGQTERESGAALSLDLHKKCLSPACSALVSTTPLIMLLLTSNQTKHFRFNLIL